MVLSGKIKKLDFLKFKSEEFILEFSILV